MGLKNSKVMKFLWNDTMLLTDVTHCYYITPWYFAPRNFVENSTCYTKVLRYKVALWCYITCLCPPFYFYIQFKNISMLKFAKYFQTFCWNSSNFWKLDIFKSWLLKIFCFYTFFAGAFGYFEVTHDITQYTKAVVFSKIGKKTDIAVRFSVVAGERGAADTVR